MDKKALTKYLALATILILFFVLLTRTSFTHNIKNYYNSVKKSKPTNDVSDKKTSIPSMRFLTADLATTGKLFKVAIYL